MLCAAYSPSGDLFVTTSGDPEIRVWNTDGTPATTCRGPMRGAFGASFAPDGRRLATAHHDGTVRLWGLDGAELAVLRGHAAAVTSVAFSPDGRFLLSTSTDGTARLWYANADDLLRVADERILRDFTREERLRFKDLLGPENRHAIDAMDLVERLLAKLHIAADVSERVRTDPTIEGEVRAHALRLAADLRDDPRLLRWQAWAIARFPGGDVARALRYAERAFELEPEDGAVLHALGVALYRKGDHGGAIEMLRNSLAAGGPDVEAHAFLALACAKDGRAEEARRHLAEARSAAAKREKPYLAQSRILAEAAAAVR
jgi:tetratricopeptide (TPR) repeat protein